VACGFCLDGVGKKVLTLRGKKIIKKMTKNGSYYAKLQALGRSISAGAARIERLPPTAEQGRIVAGHRTVEATLLIGLRERRAETTTPVDGRKVARAQEKVLERYAVTHYRVAKNMDYVSLVECKLETGRTHQIRAHLEHIGR
jgi:hypothetical protein